MGGKGSFHNGGFRACIIEKLESSKWKYDSNGWTFEWSSYSKAAVKRISPSHAPFVKVLLSITLPYVILSKTYEF